MDYQERYDNTYVHNNRRYGRPNYPGDGDYNRGYGGNDDRYQVSAELVLHPSANKARGVSNRMRVSLRSGIPQHLVRYHSCWQKADLVGVSSTYTFVCACPTRFRLGYTPKLEAVVTSETSVPI
jgi:hypothetical protein